MNIEDIQQSFNIKKVIHINLTNYKSQIPGHIGLWMMFYQGFRDQKFFKREGHVIKRIF